MTEHMVPDTEIRSRITRLQKELIKNNQDGIFLTHKPDIYYFSGTAQDCYLYVPAENNPLLFVKRYLPRAKKETSLEHTIQVKSVTDIPGIISDLEGRLPSLCGLAFDVVPVRDYHFYMSLFEDTQFEDGTPLINSCRKIKSPWEVLQIQNAADLSEKTYNHIRDIIRPGQTEMELCGLFEAYARKHGHGGKLILRHYRSEAYPFHLISGVGGGLPGAMDSPICGTGTSAAFPYGAGHKKLEKNEPILIDFGTVLNGYHMDETRMFAMGSMPDDAEKASFATIEILNQLISYMKPGIRISDVYEKSVMLAKTMGYEKEFLGLPDHKATFIGHGIGLEIVEQPILSKSNRHLLESGMVLAVEPKMLFKNRFSVGVESVIHITENGTETISRTDHTVFIC